MSAWFCARCECCNFGAWCEKCLLGVEGEWKCECVEHGVVMEVGDDHCYRCDKINPAKDAKTVDEVLFEYKCVPCQLIYFSVKPIITCESCNGPCCIYLSSN